MNSFELRYILLKLAPGIPCGVYASDQLKYIKTKSFCVIVNSERSTNAGRHWLAFIKRKGNTVLEFFDSFGLPILFYGPYFTSFVKRNGGCCRTNLNQIQFDSSNVCGNYCLYMINQRMRNKSFNSVINQFSTNKLWNDEKVRDFVSKFEIPNFSKCYDVCDGECFKNNKKFSNVCIQKSKKCMRISKRLEINKCCQ
jgi:hypothetical protein